jgi:hypothetical protein
MKMIQFLIVVVLSSVLAACSNVSQQQPVDVLTGTSSNLKPYPVPHCPPPKKKDPLNVSFYTKGKPNQHYQVVGLETVSKYNNSGIKRQEAIIKDTMRNLAAAMGGDAIINLQYEKHLVKGTVVKFDNTSEQKMA